MVCPYSLSVPGGVQAQVLGLARELRRSGHEARVLGPCDGPPPEPFVTPLGDSLPTRRTARSRRSLPTRRRRCAPSGRCATRRSTCSTSTSRSPRARPITSAHAARRADRRDVPRRRRSSSYRFLGPVLDGCSTASITRSSCRRTRSRSCSRVPRRAASTRCCSTASRPPRSAVARRRPAAPGDLLPRRHEERKGLDVLLAALRASTSTWRAGWRATGPTRQRLRPSTRRRPDRVAGPDVRPEKVARLARRIGVLRAVAARRVVRGRADRGDGGRHAGGGERARRLPQRGHRRRRRAAHPPG
jgi:phosphatidyl-myo-inositol alpha-mannosyltransferase